MNVLPNPQTNGIPGLLQGAPQGALPPGGAMPPGGPVPPGGGMPPAMPPQGAMPPGGGMPPGGAGPKQYQQSNPRQQQTPLDPKLIQAFEQMKLRQAAQRQQALQQPKKPPVIQQLLGQMQQAPERDVPDQQAIGMAGGGIVAFSGGGFSFGRDVPFSGDEASAPPPVDQDANDAARYANKGSRYFQTQLPDEKVRAMIRDAKTGDAGALRILTEYVKQYPSHVVQISKALSAQGAAAEPQGLAKLAATPPDRAQLYANRSPRAADATPPTAAAAPAPAQPGAQPDPNQPKPAAPTAAGLDALLEQGIRKGLETDPTKERDTNAAWYKEQMGMEPLLAKQEERLKSIEDLYAKRRQPGIEDWLAGLASAKPDNNPAGGLLAAAMGYRKAVGDKEASDLDFATKMAGARDAGMKLQLEGNKGIAEAGMKGFDAGRRVQSDALTQGVGLESKREATQQRREDSQARERTAQAALAERMQNAKIAAQARGDLKEQEQLRQVMGTAATMAKAAADKQFAMDPSQDYTQLMQRALDAILAQNPLYKKLMGDVGLPTAPPSERPKLPPKIQQRALEIAAGKG